MDLNVINGVIRAVVPAILAYIVGRGWIPQESVGDITAAVLAIGAAVWSIQSNKQSSVMAKAADHLEVESPKLATEVREAKASK